MTAASSILGSMFAMGLLTAAMAAWMTITRMRSMKRLGVGLQDAAHTVDLRNHLPSPVTRVADNYRHLLETPTLFYGIALAVVVGGLADPIHAFCAWVFFGARVVHSGVQATFNSVAVRATMYTISWLALATMLVRGALAIFAGMPESLGPQ